jgi:AAA family ATP:ADP antiporter
MGAGIAAALIFAVPAYAQVAKRVRRHLLIIGVSVFFAINLLGLYFLGLGVATKEGAGLWFALGFYLWVGVFNMMIVAQFWGYAADFYSEAQGKRLFPMLGIGASTGSVAGSWIASHLSDYLKTSARFAWKLGPMLLLAAVLLGCCAGLTALLQSFSTKRPATAPAAAKPSETKEADKGAGLGFDLVFARPYLILIACFSVAFTLVNTNGEYILSSLIVGAAKASTAVKEEQQAFISAYYGEFFFWVNLIGVLFQSFVVSRVVKYFGLKVGFMILPVVALGSAATVAIIPLLAVFRIGKTAENSLDYSLNNTMRNLLWLPTSSEEKYVAKQAIDTFFVRFGDVLSAGVVYLFVAIFHLGIRAIALVNIVLVFAWIAVAIAILRENAKLHAAKGTEPAAARGAT